MRPEDLVTQAFVQLHPVEAARYLETMAAPEAATTLAPLPAGEVAQVLSCCQPGSAARILNHLEPQSSADILNLLPTSVSFAVFRQLEPTLQHDVLGHMGSHLSMTFRRALHQPRQTAGHLADPGVLTLPPDIRIRNAIHRIQQHSPQAHYFLYVVDRDAKLEGVLTMKQLLVADDQDFTGSVMNDQVLTLAAALTTQELITHPHWQLFPTLPVIDRDGVFLGALRYRVLRRLIEEAVIQRAPGSLPDALIQLWEAYSLAGLRIMTDVAKTVAGPGTSQPNGDRSL